MIKKYIHDTEGYNPYLIEDGWQVAKLNYLPTHGLDDIVDVERHNKTDEVFILLKGVGVLITATFDGGLHMEFEAMKPGITYNVPAGEWHNIAMSKDCEIIIVEKDNTHINDCDHKELSKEDLERAFRQIRAAAEAELCSR